MVGININCKYQDFIKEILDGIKAIETRDSKSLDPYLGKRVGLIKTGCGRAKLMGYATIGRERIIINNKEDFDSYYQKHRVDRNSPYYIKEEKYLYYLYDVESCEPVDVYSKGIVGRRI